jgi:mannose-6-phosphate isomerase-like protein (cupin superfamily)/quercetin dioxygenase-like cupin family protein
MTNGDALFIDGRLWHGSVNSRKRGKRLALLFQYAAAENAVWIPDLSQLEWPFRLRTTPRPPVIVVSGTTRLGVNRVVPAPPPISRGQPMVTTIVHKFTLPLDNPAKPWEPFHAFRGPTRTFASLSCHASVLTGGHSPHPPHVHHDEELLIPLHGHVELLIADRPDDPAPRIERIGPGSFVYYPNWQHHTIRNPGTSPVAYLMFKWDGSGSETPSRLDTRVFHYGDVHAPAGAPPFWTQRIFQERTSHLGRLHSHLTILEPGAGYEPHIDAYDVAIVLLSGTVETLNQVVDPLSVIFYSAGEPHGIRNVGTESARYLVFEFHAPGADVLRPPLPIHRRLLRRVIRIGKRLARPLWHRLERRWHRR